MGTSFEVSTDKEAQHGNFKDVILTIQGLTRLGYMLASLKLTGKKEPLIVNSKKYKLPALKPQHLTQLKQSLAYKGVTN